MIAVIQSAIAAAFAFATSVGLHERVTETPAAPLPIRLAFDAAGVLALANALANLSHRNEPGAHVGALVLMLAAFIAWYVAVGPRKRVP